MACRCAVSLLKCFLASGIDISQLPDGWWAIFADLQIFYKELQIEDKALLERKDDNALMRILLNLEAPSYIRLNTEGDIANIADIIVDACSNTGQYSFSWLKHIPLSTEFIKSLVEKNENNEDNLFRALSIMNFVQKSPGNPLTTQQIQRILTIADTTDDPQILLGTLSVLLTSNFLNLAHLSLVLKLLRIDNNRIFLMPLSTKLFSRTRYIIESRDKNLDENMVEALAKEVLASPHDYKFRVVCEAATYLIEHTTLSLPPILQMEQELGLHIARN